MTCRRLCVGGLMSMTCSLQHEAVCWWIDEHDKGDMQEAVCRWIDEHDVQEAVGDMNDAVSVD